MTTVDDVVAFLEEHEIPYEDVTERESRNRSPPYGTTYFAVPHTHGGMNLITALKELDPYSSRGNIHRRVMHRHHFDHYIEPPDEPNVDIQDGMARIRTTVMVVKPSYSEDLYNVVQSTHP